MLGVLRALISSSKGKGVKKRKEKKKKLLQHGVFVVGPSTNPAEQDLTLLSGRDVVLSLWYSGSTLKALFLFLRQEKVTKRAKKKSSIPAENIKNEKKTRRGMKVRIITVLVIGQEAVK